MKRRSYCARLHATAATLSTTARAQQMLWTLLFPLNSNPRLNLDRPFLLPMSPRLISRLLRRLLLLLLLSQGLYTPVRSLFTCSPTQLVQCCTQGGLSTTIVGCSRTCLFYPKLTIWCTTRAVIARLHRILPNATVQQALTVTLIKSYS